MTDVNRRHNHGEPIRILLVEDSTGNARLTKEAFEEVDMEETLHVVTDGEDAMDFLNRRGEYASAECPDLVLMDLHLPGRNGREVLELIRADPQLRPLPVLMLTSSTASETMVECYESHANAYLTKPSDPAEFVSLVRAIKLFWCEQVRLPPPPA